MSAAAIAAPNGSRHGNSSPARFGGLSPVVRASVFQGIVGQSAPMLDMYARIGKIAPHYRNALITGETGAGKELVARALHDLSPVHTGHFVVINCSAVVETLFESELFGHVRGSFTGADRDKMGLFEFAHGGTMFLDEIGDMPLSTQAKLLRALQTQEVQRVGSLSGRKIDVRVVAATNKDLRQAVREKRFREDLYYRLSMVEIEMPALRLRPGDLSLLIGHFTRIWSERFQKKLAGFTAKAVERLEAHDWPGNVRELENVVGHACMMASSDVACLEDLPLYLAVSRQSPTAGSAAPNERIPLPSSLSPLASDLLEEFELRLIRQALDDAHGNQSRAARTLSTTRDRLRYKMKKYGLDNGGDPADCPDEEKTVCSV
jgi:DNA-binding NtrC family response regulator